MKAPSVQTRKSSKAAALKVLDVTRDGVRTLKPASPATHFTAREICRAIQIVRTAQTSG